ncbi:MAG: hypothetical protein Q4D89_15045 [Arachnia propionica]|uniref:hypothetical protein n=1 Tax=Arachnia propionica TaxID=1750 RepID=UPI0027098386|nr:hypothetical protein [Arachnia propionica]
MAIRNVPELTVTWRWVRPLLWGVLTALWTSAIAMIALSLTSPQGQVAPELMTTFWRWFVIAAIPAATLLLLELRGNRPGSGRRATMLLATALPIPHLVSVVPTVRTTPLTADIPVLLTAPAAPRPAHPRHRLPDGVLLRPHPHLPSA